MYKTKRKQSTCWNVQALLTLVPLKIMSLIKGNIPRMMSAPLLSTNMAAHLWGFPLIRFNQASKSSNNQGRSRREDWRKLIILHVHVIQTWFFPHAVPSNFSNLLKELHVRIVSTHQYISLWCVANVNFISQDIISMYMYDCILRFF